MIWSVLPLSTGTVLEWHHLCLLILGKWEISWGEKINKQNQQKWHWIVIYAPKTEARKAHRCEMEGRKQKISGDTAGSRDLQYNATLSCAASLTFKARMATSLLLYVQRNESKLDMLGRIVQTCKHSNSASEANSAVAYLVPPMPLVLEAACTDLLFP